jgi:hypothetical protein
MRRIGEAGSCQLIAQVVAGLHALLPSWVWLYERHRWASPLSPFVNG